MRKRLRKKKHYRHVFDWSKSVEEAVAAIFLNKYGLRSMTQALGLRVGEDGELVGLSILVSEDRRIAEELREIVS